MPLTVESTPVPGLPPWMVAMDSDVGTRNEVKERRRASAWKHGAIEPPIVVSALGLAPHESAALKTALTVVEGRTHVPACYGEVTAAHIVVTPRSVLRDSRFNAALRGRRVIVYRHEADAPARADDVSLVAPIRPDHLLQALNTCFDRLGAAIRHDRRVPASSTALDEHAHHSGTLAHALLRIFAQPHEHDAHVRAIGYGTLSILMHRRRYHTDFASDRLHEAMRSRRYVVSGNCDDARQLRDNKLRPLVELRWVAGLEGYSPEETPLPEKFQLKRWPDFGNLPHELEQLKLAALFSGRVLTLDFACRTSGMDARQVGAFLHACLICGYLEPVGTTPAVQPVATTPAGTPSGLFARLRRHFMR